MKATIFSILLGVLLWFIPLQGDIGLGFGFAFIALPIALFATMIIALASAWAPLQKAEQNITPRLLEMFARDKRVKLSALMLSLFPLVSVVIGILFAHAPEIDNKILLITWIVLFGLALDFIWYFVKRVTSYLDPFKATEIISTSAKQEIKLNQLELLIDSVDALSEVSLRAIERSNTSLAQQSIGELRDIGSLFLSSSKSFANLNQDLSTYEQTRVDKVSYTLFTLLSRLEMIGIKAADRRYEPVVSQVITTFGRLAISAAHYDLSLATYPILSVGKTATMAEKKGLSESGIKGEIVLLQVAKTIVNELDLSYVDLKSPFLTLIENLDQIIKERFKQNKEISIKILTQPFLELQSLFKEEKVAGHQDTPVILTELDRVLAEFTALQSVMSTISLPPLETL